MLYKQFYLARRNPAIPAQEWPRVWRSHALYVSREFKGAVSAISGVSYCSRVLYPTLGGALFDPPQASRDYDGVAVVVSPSADAFRAAVWGISDEEWRAATGLSQDDRRKVEADELRVFATHVSNFSFRCRETLVHGDSAGMAAIIRFLCRGPRSTRAAFDAALMAHGEVARQAVDATDAATGHVHNALREPPPPDYPFDGVTETWFANADDATRAFIEPAFKAVAADLARFCDAERSVTMLCHVTHRWPRQ